MRKRIFSGFGALAIAVIIVLTGSNPSGAVTTGSWAHSDGTAPTVYVENHSDGHWGITDAINAWNGAKMHLVYGSCAGHANCITVLMYRTTSNYIAQTAGSNGYNSLQDVTIYLNSYYTDQGSTEWHRRHNALEHELGHAVGLGHDNGCSIRAIMCAALDNGTYYITDYERRELHSLYGV